MFWWIKDKTKANINLLHQRMNNFVVQLDIIEARINSLTQLNNALAINLHNLKEQMMAKKPALGSGKRFAAIEHKAKKEGYSEESSKKIAASIGRKKYGAAKMSKMAQAGKKRKAKE